MEFKPRFKLIVGSQRCARTCTQSKPSGRPVSWMAQTRNRTSESVSARPRRSESLSRAPRRYWPGDRFMSFPFLGLSECPNVRTSESDGLGLSIGLSPSLGLGSIHISGVDLYVRGRLIRLFVRSFRRRDILVMQPPKPAGLEDHPRRRRHRSH